MYNAAVLELQHQNKNNVFVLENGSKATFPNGDRKCHFFHNETLKLSFFQSEALGLVVVGDLAEPKYSRSELEAFADGYGKGFESAVQDILQNLGFSDVDEIYEEAFGGGFYSENANAAEKREAIIDFMASMDSKYWYESFAKNTHHSSAYGILLGQISSHEALYSVKDLSGKHLFGVVSITKRALGQAEINTIHQHLADVLPSCIKRDLHFESLVVQED